MALILLEALLALLLLLLIVWWTMFSGRKNGELDMKERPQPDQDGDEKGP
jgi:cbb3-type cytochrome oxidase subunit 3